jgi:fructose-1,6-bisphosphatase/inositol monophosphatase family enzyme
MTKDAAIAIDDLSVTAQPEPQPQPLERELSIAIDAARRAGRLQMERYERLERIVHKSEHDVVTEVDEMSELLIISGIREAYPHDGFLAEESGQIEAVPPEGESVVDPSEHRVWIIDPLDGTVNYANGIPVFCVSIGLVVGGLPVLGVIYDPVRDELFSAQAGLGARLDGSPIRHPAKEKLSDCVVSLSLPRGGGWYGRERKIRRKIRVARVIRYPAREQVDRPGGRGPGAPPHAHGVLI